MPERDAEEHLRDIGRGYHTFLKQSSLVDTKLTRMTYFYTAKKEYVDDPLEDKEQQEDLIRTLDAWLDETLTAMEATTPPPPDSLVLHVVKAV